MLQKFFLFLVGIFLMGSFSIAQIQAAQFEVTSNLNIRLKPGIEGTRIGYFKKGEQVFVHRTIANWCEVSYKNFPKAYVYCPFLKQVSTSAESSDFLIILSETQQESFIFENNGNQFRFSYPKGKWRFHNSTGSETTNATDFEFISNRSMLYSPGDRGYLLPYLRNITQEKSQKILAGWKKFSNEDFLTDNGFHFHLDFYELDHNVVTNNLKLSDWTTIKVLISEINGSDGKTVFLYAYDVDDADRAIRELKQILNTVEKTNFMSIYPKENPRDLQNQYVLKYPSHWVLDEYSENSRFSPTFVSYPKKSKEDFSYERISLEVNKDCGFPISMHEFLKKEELTNENGYQFSLNFYRGVPLENEKSPEEIKNAMLVFVKTEKMPKDNFAPQCFFYRYSKIYHPNGEQTLKEILQSIKPPSLF